MNTRKTKAERMEEQRLAREASEAADLTRWASESPTKVLELLTKAAKSGCEVRVRMSRVGSPVVCYEFECYSLEYDKEMVVPVTMSEREYEEATYFVSRAVEHFESETRKRELRESALGKLSNEERNALGV